MRELGGALVYAKRRWVQGNEHTEQRVYTVDTKNLLNTDSNIMAKRTIYRTEMVHRFGEARRGIRQSYFTVTKRVLFESTFSEKFWGEIKRKREKGKSYVEQ